MSDILKTITTESGDDELMLDAVCLRAMTEALLASPVFELKSKEAQAEYIKRFAPVVLTGIRALGIITTYDTDEATLIKYMVRWANELR